MDTYRNNILILKSSNIIGKIPSTDDLVLGEVAVNVADAKLYSLFTSGLSASTEVRQVGWDKLSLSGGSINGHLSANTVSATTYYGDGSNLSNIINKVSIVGSTPNPSGATISGSTLILQPANELYGGIVSTGNQLFHGCKGFGSNNIILSGASISFGFGSSHEIGGNACVGLGEASFLKGEANTSAYGYGNGTGDDVTDSLVGGTGSNAIGGHGIISLGVGNNGYTGYTTIIGGEANVGNGLYSSIYGSLGNTVNGQYSGIFSGFYNILNGNNSAIIGGSYIIGDDDNTLFTDNIKAIGIISGQTIYGNGSYLVNVLEGFTGSTFSANTLYIVDRYGQNIRINVDGFTGLTINGKLSQGYSTISNGLYSHSEGESTSADGDFSHAQGFYSMSDGDYSHAEGSSTISRGNSSHAEGHSTVSYGLFSHTEGFGSNTFGNYAHAEGESTIASGTSSHAEGYYTVSEAAYQHVSGRYNTTGNSANSISIIGCGSSNSLRQDAFRVDLISGQTAAITLIGKTILSGSVINPLQITGLSNSGNTRFLVSDSNGFISYTTLNNSDVYTTGATFSNNTLILTNNTGGTVSTLINNFSGLTVNGVLSASTISGNSIYGTWRGDYIDKKILAYRAMGSTIVAENVDGQLAAVNAGQTMVSQRLYLSAVYLDKVQTITGLKWRQITAGSYSGNNYNGVAMYSYSAGTLSLVASSSTDNNIWTATTGSVGVKAFSTPYSAQAGLYFVGYLYNAASATTAPNIGILGAASSVNTVTDFTNSAKTSGLISSQTSLPTSLNMSSISAAATEYWGALYGT